MPSTVLGLQFANDVFSRNQRRCTGIGFRATPFRDFQPFLLDRPLFLREKAIEKILRKAASLLHGERQRLLLNFFVAPAHNHSLPRPYRASTASRSFSA